ncbi:hypothetical protein [Mucisphaera calidilacus]|uniref:Dockerin domain-containing protein n=1 Tax=Mucisphaera calidilacus TaxID=2527982 RepID=A0A518BZY9_9BACT|nr:hypothetical protein [Mucisphaera calidilacus]QDU72531.1 hypothetical protein Pan265_24000 [Mucisphaera calidilacus]
MRRTKLWACSLAAVSLGWGSSAWGLEAENVLVVYNSTDADSQAVYDYYLASRPGVLGFDINNPTVTGSTLSYTDYTDKLRDPIRDYLTMQGLEEQVSVITLTKGVPHRIDDMNSPGAGGLPPTAATLFDNGEATYASVDSELTLLWQDTGTVQEGGRTYADNAVINPYFGTGSSSRLMEFDRTGVTDAKDFTWGGSFHTMFDADTTQRADGGDILLTARLDGYTVDDVKGMIDRAQNPVFNSEHYTVVLDENAAGTLDDEGAGPGDYDRVGAAPFPFFYPAIEFDDNGPDFLIGEETDAFEGTVGTRVVEGPVAALFTYGGNHNGGSSDNRGFIETWSGQLVDGAIYNGLESYSARNFNGITNGYNDQGQLADWIAAGGTFGTGTVYEPFTFGIAENYYLFLRMAISGTLNPDNAYTWVEAAWAGIPYLSWQNMVLGDPLATLTITDVALGDVAGDFDLNALVDARDLDLLGLNLGDPAYDLDGDLDADADDISFWVRDLYGSELGDANLDFAVDLLDLSVLASNFDLAEGATWSDGDFNGDGAVDLLDLSLLASGFGYGADVPAPAPEPAAGLLLLVPALLRRR